MTNGTPAGRPEAETAQAETARDEVFAALASPVRRDLLGLLREHGPMQVQELAAHFQMRRPSVSEHLKVLRDAELVDVQRSGRNSHYRLKAQTLVQVSDWLSPYERFWREKLGRLSDLLDEEEDEPTP